MLPMAILSGGYATRLGRLTKDVPKCLVEINGRPFVDWQLDLLMEGGYSDFVFCVSYKSDLVQDHLGDGSDLGVQIRYSLDGNHQLGTGGSIQKALPLLGEEFAVIYGDSYLPINYREVEKNFLASTGLAMMVIYKNQNNFDVSNVEYGPGALVNYQKGLASSRMQHIDYGLTYFRSAAFPALIGPTSFDLADRCHQLSKELKLEGFEVSDRFYEIGSLSGIEEFSKYLGKAHE